MWSKTFNQHKIYKTELLVEEVKRLNLTGNKRTTIKHKNRFLLCSANVVHKTANLFVFKGFKLKYLKVFNYASLFFFRCVQSVKTSSKENNQYKCTPIVWVPKEYPMLNKLLLESYLYHNLNLIIPYFLAPSLPMIKSICLTKKYLKKKKILKKKLAKYTLRYKYVPHSQRALVVLRWFGMIVKTKGKSLVDNLILTTLNTAKQDEKSFIEQIRNQVYAGLALEKD